MKSILRILGDKSLLSKDKGFSKIAAEVFCDFLFIENRRLKDK
jgi:hypothetical protein